MNKEGAILPIFSTPIIKTNIKRRFTEDEMRCISNLQMIKSDEKQYDESGYFLEMSRDANHHSKETYLFDTFTEEFKDIKLFCEFHIKQYLEDISGADTDIVNLRITQSWLNNTKPNEHHHSHSHANSYISGVLYINCLPNDNIVFENRQAGIYDGTLQFKQKKITRWNAHGFSCPVEEGDLLLFPSWVPHHVVVNETKYEERITLSFNTFPIGEMGYIYGTHLKL